MFRSQTVVAGLLALGAGCHVMAHSELVQPVATEHILHPEAAVAGRPQLVWTDGGKLRFVEPLACPSEQLVRRHTRTEIVIRPNLATFTVGVIATALGGVMLTSGLFKSQPGDSPLTYVGASGAALGLPFAIGPWIGNRTELREPDAAHATPAVRQPGPSLPCGERPLVARSATLDADGLEIRGTIDRDGVFAISPYQWIDAYAGAALAPSAVKARVDGDRGARTLEAVLDAGPLASHASDFLAHADFDARIEPLKLVSGVTAGAVRVSLTTADGGPAVRVAVALRNEGPGDAWAVRGQITAPATPAIDGRILYVGKLAKGAVVTRELVIPLAAAAASALRDATLELTIELRDAHGTVPSTPLRFAGRLSGDAR